MDYVKAQKSLPSRVAEKAISIKRILVSQILRLAGEAVHEGDEGGDFSVGEITIKLVAGHGPDSILESGHRAVVEIRSGEGDIPQTRNLKTVKVSIFAGEALEAVVIGTILDVLRPFSKIIREYAKSLERGSAYADTGVAARTGEALEVIVALNCLSINSIGLPLEIAVKRRVRRVFSNSAIAPVTVLRVRPSPG